MEWHEINDPAGRPHEEIGSGDEPPEDLQATLAACFERYQCQHLYRRINLSTCCVECLDCSEMLLDLDPLVPQSLRVARNLP